MWRQSEQINLSIWDQIHYFQICYYFQLPKIIIIYSTVVSIANQNKF